MVLFTTLVIVGKAQPRALMRITASAHFGEPPKRTSTVAASSGSDLGPASEGQSFVARARSRGFKRARLDAHEGSLCRDLCTNKVNLH